MIGYVMFGTNDLAKSAAFYDALLSEFGAKRTFGDDNFIVWGTEEGGAMLSVTKPYNGQEATIGNGVMVALAASGPEQVDRVYKKAIELGAPVKVRRDLGIFRISMRAISAIWTETSSTCSASQGRA